VSKLIFDFHFFSFRRTRTRAEENFHKLDQFSSVKSKCVSRSIFFTFRKRNETNSCAANRVHALFRRQVLDNDNATAVFDGLILIFSCLKLRNALDLYVTRNKTWRGLSLISCYRNLNGWSSPYLALEFQCSPTSASFRTCLTMETSLVVTCMHQRQRSYWSRTPRSSSQPFCYKDCVSSNEGTSNVDLAAYID